MRRLRVAHQSQLVHVEAVDVRGREASGRDGARRCDICLTGRGCRRHSRLHIARLLDERVLDSLPRGGRHIDALGEWDAVERDGARDRVGAHVLEDHVGADVELGQHDLLVDEVEAVARRPPDRRLIELALVTVTVVAVDEHRRALGVIVEQAVEGGVHAVVDVVHDGLLGRVVAALLDHSFGNDAHAQSERRTGVVAAGLGNHAQLLRVAVELIERVGGKEALERAVDLGGHLVEQVHHVRRAGIAAAQVEQVHAAAAVRLARIVEQATRVLDRFAEGARRHLTAADVEAHADEVEAELHRQVDQLGRGVHVGTELHAELAHGILVVGDDAEDALGRRMVGLDLVQLCLVVEGHVVDAGLVRIADHARLLARIGEYDAVRRDAQVEHLLDLVLAGAVEAGAQERQQLEHHHIRVALDSIVRFCSFKLVVKS